MNLEVEIVSLERPLGAALLKLPSHLAEAGALRLVGAFKALSMSGTRSFVLDLTGTDLLTSSGLGALHHLFRESGGRVVLLGPDKKAQRLFGVSGLLAPWADSLEEAQTKLEEAG